MAVDGDRLRALFGRLVVLNERHEIEHVGTPVAIDTARYASRDRHELELQKLFREEPQLVAFSCDLPGPNTFTTGRIGDIPLLLSRDGDGVLRAFVNACRHRGAPVAQGSGSGRRLSCPYHGWTYDLDGRLAGPMTRVGYTYDAFGTHHRMGLLSVNADTDGGGGEEAMELLESLTLVHHLYPSSMLVVGSGIVVHQRCDPGRTPDTCWLRVSTYSWGAPADDDARAGQQMLSDLLWKVVLEEDCWVQQGAQQAFSSGAIDRVVFGANEPGLRGMHAAWDAALR